MYSSGSNTGKDKEPKIKNNFHSSGRGGAGNIRVSALSGMKSSSKASSNSNSLSDRDSVMTAATNYTSSNTSPSSQTSSSILSSRSHSASVTSDNSHPPPSSFQLSVSPPSPIMMSSSTTQSYKRPNIDENMSITFGREFAVQPTKSGRTGRGGAGKPKNTLGNMTEYTDASHYPQTAALMKEHEQHKMLQERAIIERSREAAKTRHSTGRGGAGNLMFKKQGGGGSRRSRRDLLHLRRPSIVRPRTTEGLTTTSYRSRGANDVHTTTSNPSTFNVPLTRSQSLSRSIHSANSTQSRKSVPLKSFTKFWKKILRRQDGHPTAGLPITTVSCDTIERTENDIDRDYIPMSDLSLEHEPRPSSEFEHEFM